MVEVTNPLTREKMERVPNHLFKDECDWCGTVGKRMFIYGPQPLSPYSPRVFCNLDCWRSFNA